jgi:hypothetical protein
MSRGGQLRFEQHIPKFLQGLVKPRPASRDSDDDDDERPTVAAQHLAAEAAAAADRDAHIEDRPDRDDEAPVITNADEYEKELENNLVVGVALPLPKVRLAASGASAGKLTLVCALKFCRNFAHVRDSATWWQRGALISL